MKLFVLKVVMSLLAATVIVSNSSIIHAKVGLEGSNSFYQDNNPSKLILEPILAPRNNELIELLHLSDEQLMVRTSLLSRFSKVIIERQREGEFRGKGSFPLIMSVGNEVFADFDKILTPEQLKIKDAYYRFLRLGRDKRADMFGLPAVKEFLELNPAQVKELGQIANEFKQKTEKAEQEAKEALRNRLQRIDKEFVQALLPHQANAFHEKLGKVFDFKSKEFLIPINDAMSVIRLHNTTYSGMRKARQASHNFAFRTFLGGATAMYADSSHAASTFPAVLIELLWKDSVAADVNFNEDQKTRIVEEFAINEDRDRHYIPLEVKSPSRRVAGLNIDSVSRNGDPGAEYLKSDIEALEKILQPSQMKRLVQIFHQFLLTVRTEDGLMLLNDDWKAALMMSREQQQEFDEFVTQAREDLARIASNSAAELQQIKQDGYDRCIEVLTDEQLTAWIDERLFIEEVMTRLEK